MEINANSIRAGNVLEFNGRLVVVSKTPERTQPGKGGAFVQVEMKDIRTGTKLNERFRTNENVVLARLDQKDYQYLFMDDNHVTLMDMETFDQLTVDRSLVGDKAVYLQEGMVVIVESYEDDILNVQLPEHVILTIEECEPVVKGQTATASFKPAILENGVRIMVPQFIESGTRVVVKTSDDSYVERAK